MTYSHGWHLADRSDIVKWADRMEARSEFPGLIRGLIQRNNDQLIEVEMRAAEGTGAPGYDGVTRAAAATPFVPSGDSVWELGTGADFKAKANKDFRERSQNPLGRDPKMTTFVFVTPRQWTEKQDWVAARKEEAIWADVRVFDVDDIEQAMELAPAVHARFSERVGKAPYGAQTIENWWEGSTSLTSPPLDPELVLSGRTNEASDLLRLFEAESRLTTIAAPSVDDVLAFVAATVMSSLEAQREELLGRALIVRDALSLRMLALSEGLLILLPFEDDLRREARLIRSHHVVIRAEDGTDSSIKLPPIEVESFTQLLKDRGEEDERAGDLARAAHRSIVMFQRRAASPGIAPPPPWASHLSSRVTRRGWLVGRWNERRSGDSEALGVLFESSYEQARDELVALTSGADPLFVGVGDTWKVVSIEDAWQYGHLRLQPSDLAAFEVLIQSVLGAVDPKLELPVEDRWKASLYGKSRIHSTDLREGIAEVLALLGARGETVTIGSGTIQSWLRRALWQLFQRANEDKTGHLWASLPDVLPLLAEAAPDVFLEAVQNGLEGEQPLLGAMFADRQKDALSVSSPHTGLLWALENVAWSSEHFSMAVEQLARLAEVDPGGRLSNRPAFSLASIYRPWLPQTSVGADRRIATLDGLRKRHSTVAWSLMLSMLPEHHAVGHYNHAPRFRDWKPDETGRIPDDRQVVELAIADRLVEDVGTDSERWVELVSRFDDLPQDAFLKAVKILENLGQSSDVAELRARIWEPLHALVQRHQRYGDADWAMVGDRIELLQDLQEKLAPLDPVQRIRWLFDDHLPDLPELTTEDFAGGAYMEAVDKRRANEIQELIKQAGFDGVLELAKEAQYPWFVGVAVADSGAEEIGQVLLDHLDSDNARLVSAAAGWATRRGANDWPWVEGVATSFAGRPVAVARLLLASEDLLAAWHFAERDAAVDAAYWAEFSPYGRGGAFALAEEASQKLLAHDRPRTALMLMNLYAGSVEIDRNLVMEGLERLLRLPEDHPDQFRVDGHEIERLLDYIRAGKVEEERLGLLEWHLRPALRFDAHSPVLERKLARDPAFFVEVLSMAFNPSSGEPDRDIPPHTSMNAYRLLDDWQVVPGTDETGILVAAKLDEWIDKALVLLAEADRLGIGLDQVGKILAKATGDPDDTWPPVPVRDVIERLSSSELDDGFRVQIHNSRGVTSRGLAEGGEQERKLSERYSGLSTAVRDGWPRTAAILRSVAESYATEAQHHDQNVERLREGLDP